MLIEFSMKKLIEQKCKQYGQCKVIDKFNDWVDKVNIRL